VEVIHATEVAKTDAAPLGDLVPRGKVEVRILREFPDLVGGRALERPSGARRARRALGLDLLPTASGNLLYELSTEVACDWMRFRALVEIAKRSGIGRERARPALIQALALVDGVPGVVSRRFIWLDTDGLLAEIANAVELARRAIAGGS
jgi:hypothetical protein